MTLLHHVTASAIISGALFLIFRSWGLAATSLLSGIFIDLDHVIDYIRERGFRYDTRRFFDFFYEEKYDSITLIFHGWEWLALLLFLSWRTEWNPLVTGTFIGCSQHLILDKIYNIATFGSYSFFWRLINGFDPNRIVLKNRRKQKREPDDTPSEHQEK